MDFTDFLLAGFLFNACVLVLCVAIGSGMLLWDKVKLHRSKDWDSESHAGPLR